MRYGGKVVYVGPLVRLEWEERRLRGESRDDIPDAMLEVSSLSSMP